MPLVSLPPELISSIADLLPSGSLRQFSGVSSFIRQVTIPLLFRSVLIRGDVNEPNGVGANIKQAIREVYVSIPHASSRRKSLRVFRSLEALPNLAIITFQNYSAPLRPRELHDIVTIAQKTALRHVHLSMRYDSFATGPPVIGPQGLESISVEWMIQDDPSHPGSSMAHLSAFLRPSFCTLACLKLRDYVNSKNPQFLDFRGVGSICHSLRRLDYSTRRPFMELIQEINEMFPNLTYLKVVCKVYMQSWTDDFIKPLSSLSQLKHLNLGLDLEISAGDQLNKDHDLAWYRRCFLRRYSVSEKIAAVCPMLERCEWTHLGIDSEGNDQQHDFVVREEAGNRVVRPMMQWWMTDEFKSEHGGTLPDLLVPETLSWKEYMIMRGQL